MAVPCVPRKRESRPAMTSAAMRPWRFAGPASGDVRLRAGDKVRHLDGIAHRVDVGDARSHLVVDEDAAAIADRKAGGAGEPESPAGRRCP